MRVVLMLLLASASIDLAFGACENVFSDSALDGIKIGYKSRRGSEIYTEAEVIWNAINVVGDLACFTEDELEDAILRYKPVKEGAGWTDHDGKQRRAGKAGSKWTVDVKPCLEYRFQLEIKGSMLEIGSVGPANVDQIADSGFAPDAPEGLEATAHADEATLSFQPSDCADQYDVIYKPLDGGEEISVKVATPEINVADLKPCTSYEVTVWAMLNGEYSESELISNFATKPRKDSVNSVTPAITPELNSVSVSWNTYDSVSCINDYQVKICKKDDPSNCPTSTTVQAQTITSSVNFEQQGLEQCTDYILTITPLYEGNGNLDSKDVPFTTKSPSADSATVGEVTTVLDHASIKVGWSLAQCAASYKVYQKVDGGEWEEQGEIQDESKTTVQDITPCTKYQFAVTAVMPDMTETVKAEGPQVTSFLEVENEFVPANIHENAADEQIEITWNHAHCIESYIIKLCDQSQECTNHSAEPEDTSAKTISYTLPNLSSCTKYTYQIFPKQSGKDFPLAKIHETQTTHGTPEAPQNFAVIKQNDYKATLEWNEAFCASGYKVYINEQEQTPVEETHMEYAGLKPCQTNTFAVATVVKDQESVKTESQSLEMPPDLEKKPELSNLTVSPNSITFQVKQGMNALCAIEKYELQYTTDGGNTYKTKTFTAAEAPNHEITLKTPTNNLRVEGKVIYANDKGTSELQVWGEEPLPVPDPQKAGMDPLIPIGVGVAVLVIIVIVVVVMILRRKDARKKTPDAERNGGGAAQENGNSRKHAVDSDETQKLNANVDDETAFA